jgi:alanine racemase
VHTPYHIADVCQGELEGSSHIAIKHLITDSRTITSYGESCFFALISERNNGHKFIQAMYDKGVRCFVVSEDVKPPATDCAFIKVNNTLEALQKIASHHRDIFKIPAIGITGSNGKTIVKEWLYQLLKHRYNICRSPKSYNSQIGVPLSVWNLNVHHNLGIFEAGISQTNEMQKLQNIIQPNLGVFTGIGAAHREGFDSKEEKIKEKFLLFASCETIVVNGLQKQEIPESYRSKNIIRIGQDGHIVPNKITTHELHTDLELQYLNTVYKIEIPFTDAASVSNALTCFGVLVALKLNLEDYIPLFKNLSPVALRLEIKNGTNNCVLINDYYNSDLDSLQIALNYLNQHKRSQSRTVIISDIEQSGLDAKELYRQIAAMLKQNHVDKLVAVGKDIAVYKSFFSGDKYFFDDTRDLLKSLNEGRIFFHNTTILLKGGRRFGFENISQLLQQKSHDTVLEINLNKLTDNINYYRSLINKDVKIMCMVKAMGYGSGSSEIAKTLQHIGVNYLAVAYADEGVELRNAQIQLPIMVMSPEEDSLEDIVNFNLEPEIYSQRILEMFCRQLNKSGVSEPYPVHIKIDTGMHRLGFEEKDFEALSELLLNTPQVKVQSVFSHLVGTDNPSLDGFTNEQIFVFEKACALLENKLGYTFIKHICNSGGVTRFKQAHYDMVRLGIGMYGIGVNEAEQKKLQNVSSLKTRISQIKHIGKGQTVGYNRNGKTDADISVATIPVGYADGFRRDLGNGKITVLINGNACKTIGNVCMDMCMVDVTGISCKEGDEVIIFENFEQIQKLSDVMRTISYEVLTSISARVKRVYVQE